MNVSIFRGLDGLILIIPMCWPAGQRILWPDFNEWGLAGRDMNSLEDVYYFSKAPRLFR